MSTSHWFSFLNKREDILKEEEGINPFVYDEKLGKWIKNTKTQYSNSCPPEFDTQMPPSLPLNFHYHKMVPNVRRDRYIDPFTYQIHHCIPPLVFPN
ncbi:hypothetical protein KM1_089310 [Entamoeba histolytica HM-3:IMSS]|uniref:Uncharacterized protein n=1 Tax=Entamoeba histolytica HM-3:IMSS TaxID=885315 RepID=M7X020_ENTHI|nr:hypothetical protein KM1_089310 [Entamoeba histolytica HM-3:IMSS]